MKRQRSSVMANLNQLCFLDLDTIKNSKTIAYILSKAFFQEIKDVGVNCIICPSAIAEEVKNEFNGGICISDDPKNGIFPGS